MLLSKQLQFIVLLASLIASIPPGSSAENVYTVTPTTNLSPNLQYINTSQLRQKTTKSAEKLTNDPVAAIYDRKPAVRVDKGDANDGDDEQLERSKEALKQLLDRRLIKSANKYVAPVNRSRTIERLVGGYLQYQSKNNLPPPSRKSLISTTTTPPTEWEEFITEATPDYLPFAAESNDVQLPSTTTTELNILSTTTFSTSSTEEKSEEAITTTSWPPSTTTTTAAAAKRRSTTIASRGATRHHYYDIRQNSSSSNKPSIKSPQSSPSPSPRPLPPATKIYFKRKNETLTMTTTPPSSSDFGAMPTVTIKVPKIVASIAEEESKLISSNSLSSSASHVHKATTGLPDQFDDEFAKDHYLTDSLEDAALLEIDQELDNWDSGLLRASAGAGLESSAAAAAAAKPENKKTLSDQVAEGKYGLIQTELFQKPIQRPGVLSYEKNAEVPKDTEKNLGGLTDDEIWLAEDHLLILKGGSLAAGESDWVPIDAYEAPQRQVRIPPNPEVPPPFPVQLDENGPVQFIGNNQAPFFGAFPNHPLPPGFGNGPPPPPGQYPPSGAPGGDPQNLPPWPGSVQNFTTENGYNYPPPPPQGQNPFLNYGPPPLPTGGGGSPFGVGVPPPFINGSLENVNNTADYPDEDDPSLYYPPPYSFVYKSNYSNPVPPGPLVPGIVLPPPPNFFTRLEGSLQKQQQNKGHGNRTALRKRPPPRLPIVRPHQIASGGGGGDSQVTKITKLTTTNLPPSVRRPTTTMRTTTTSTTTTMRTSIPTRLVNKPQQLPNQQNLYIPKYKDQENIVINYQPPPPPPSISSNRFPKPLAPDYEDHYHNTVEQPPPPSLSPPAVTQLKKVNDPLIRFISPQSNPVYFEYFDAQQKGGHRTSTPGPTYIPIPVTTTSTSTPAPPSTLFDYDNYAYVTPQPEIRPNGEPPQLTIHTQPDIIYQRLPTDPIKSNFNHEVETIRQTLNYYQSQPQLIPLSQQGQQQQHQQKGGQDDSYLQNQLQRTPKAKPVYQYSFDVSNEGQGIVVPSTSPKYQVQSSIRPSLLDTTPFKPMVQYSAPLGSQADRDGFKPFKSYFSSSSSSSTSASIPVTSPRPTKTRSKLLPIIGGNSQLPLGRPQQFNLNGDHLYNLQFGNNGAAAEGHSSGQNGLRGSGYLRNAKPGGSSFTGYYYDQPHQQQQQQQQHHTAVDPYMQQIAALRQKLRHHSTFHEFYQHPNYNHFSNATSSALRYYPGQGPQRPNSRYTTDNQNYNQRAHHNLLAPQNQNTQYYSRVQTHPQTAQQQQQQQQQFLSLEKDILVNYKYPLPAGNPDAETLPAEFLEQHRRPSNQQRPNFYVPSAPQGSLQQQQQQQPPSQYNQQQFYQYRLPGDQAHVYFLAPPEDGQQRSLREAKSMAESREEEEEDKEEKDEKKVTSIEKQRRRRR